MDELFDYDVRRRPPSGEVLPCGCLRQANPEDECNGWHWAREEWDDRG